MTNWQIENVIAAEEDELWARKVGHFDAACFFQNQAKRFTSGELTPADTLGRRHDWRERIRLSGCTHAQSFRADQMSNLLEQ